MKLEGWRVTRLSTVVIVVMIAMILSLGVNEEAMRLVLRATARASLVLFSLAFSASSLARVFDSTLTRWLLRNRRPVGVSFAISHFIHLGLIVALNLSYPRPFFGELPPAAIAASVVTYLWIAAMAATSSDRAVAWLGRRRWRVLHLAGSYAIWAFFAYSYLPWAFYDAYYVACSTLVVLAMALRGIARWTVLKDESAAR